MPIYEYLCEACGEKTELMQRITAEPLDTCPLCQTQGRIHRLISKTGFQLKGNGWYETDFSGRKRPHDDGHAGADIGGGFKSNHKTESDASASAASPSSSSETSSDSKSSSPAKESATAPADSTPKAATAAAH